MQYKPIENYHVENAILGKDFNLGMTGSFFHAFTLMLDLSCPCKHACERGLSK